jgi:preprotein translocase subunit SecA
VPSGKLAECPAHAGPGTTVGSHERHLRLSVVSDDLESYRPLIEAINALESELSAEADAALHKRAQILRQHATRGEPLAEFLEESFALVREVSRRTIGLRPFDVRTPG